MPLGETFYPLLSTAFNPRRQEIVPTRLKIVDWDVKQQHKQTLINRAIANMWLLFEDAVINTFGTGLCELL